MAVVIVYGPLHGLSVSQDTQANTPKYGCEVAGGSFVVAIPDTAPDRTGLTEWNFPFLFEAVDFQSSFSVEPSRLGASLYGILAERKGGIVDFSVFIGNKGPVSEQDHIIGGGGFARIAYIVPVFVVENGEGEFALFAGSAFGLVEVHGQPGLHVGHGAVIGTQGNIPGVRIVIY